MNVCDGVVPALRRALDDQDSLVREEASASLGRLGPLAAEATDDLVERARVDPVRPVRAAAAVALRRLGERKLASDAEASAEAAPEAPGLLELLEKLASPDPRTRAEASWPIGKFGADAAPGLEAIVRQLRTDHDPDARWGAAWVVGRIGPAAVESVADVSGAVTDEPDPDVRAQAAHALGLIGSDDSATVDALVHALGDDGASFLREEAAIAIGRIGAATAQTIPALRARLADPHPMVRQAAAVALATLQGL
jgi:HEAT repeat protein